MPFILNLVICYAFLPNFTVFKGQLGSSLPFQPISFKVQCYNKDLRLYPISKPLCPKEQVFLPGEKGMQMNGRKGLAAVQWFCR